MAIESPQTVPSPPRPQGRWLFGLGWLLAILGIAAYFVQLFALKQFVVPWYAPVLASIGGIVMVIALGRWTVLRIFGL